MTKGTIQDSPMQATKPATASLNRLIKVQDATSNIQSKDFNKLFRKKVKKNWLHTCLTAWQDLAKNRERENTLVTKSK